MAELKVYQRREEHASRGNAMEEKQVQKHNFLFPPTPVKPITRRSQKTYGRRGLKKNLSRNSLLITDSQLDLEDSNEVSLFSSAPSFSEENKGLSNPIAALPTKEKVHNCSGITDTNLGFVDLFDLNKIVLESDDTNYAYMDSEKTSKGFLEAELAVEHVANNDNEVLTMCEEQLLQGSSVTSPTPQSSPSATERSSFDMMSTCFSQVVQSHIDAEKPKEPIGNMLPSVELWLGPAIPDSMSQCKSDDQQNQKKQENHTKNDDCKFNAANCIGGSALPSTSSLSGKKNNLKRRPEGGKDLNGRPQKRRKKRGYRPRVVGVGKPRRTLEPKTPQKATPKPKTPKPTTRMPASSKTNMSVKKSSSNLKNLVPKEVSVDKVDLSVSDRPTLNIDLQNQSNDELATPPRKARIGRQKAKDSSLDSEGSSYFAAVDAEAGKLVGNCINQNDWQYNAFQVDQKTFLVNQCLNSSRNLGLNFPKICRKQRMRRRRWNVDRWSVLASKFHENASHVTLRGTNKKSVPKKSQKEMFNMVGYKNHGRLRYQTTEIIDLTDGLQSLIKTKNKRSKGRTVVNFAGLTATPICNQLPRALLRERVSERQETETFQRLDANKAVLFANENGGAVTDKWTDMGHSLVNLELHEGPCFTNLRQHECEEGAAEERLTKMVPSLLNLEFRNDKTDRSLLQNETMQLTEKSIDSPEDNISPLVQKCPYVSHGGNHDQDAHVARNDQGILVPYQGQRDQGTNSPHGQLGMLADKGKNNKRLAELSDAEYELALTWKVQMEDKVNEDQRKEGDEDWWRNEREVFHGRINLLISRMHIIQGDRKFSPWKGSVVDSVVGVFLTQNVSDHLSSSAFLSLAARFPCQSTSNKTDCKDINMVGNQESIGSSIVSIIPVSDEELLTCEAAECGNKESSSDESNDFEGASRSRCGSYKPPEVSQIHFNEKVDHVEILEDSLVSYNPQVQQNLSTEVGFHASEGMSSLPPECSSPTKDEGAALYYVNMPLDKPESTTDTTMIQNPKLCSQPPNDANSFNQKEQKGNKLNLKQRQSDMKSGETKKATRRGKKEKAIVQAKTDWEFCRKIYGTSGERNTNHIDSVDWEAVRHAEVGEIAHAIRVRGQQNLIAERVKKFLNQVYQDHKQIDLEWLRNAPPALVKKYLRDIKGIGLKSVECVRLLTLQHVAFPVDVNVGRIAIRLGWVPLQPLPESLQIHLLKEMPVFDSVQQYLWPRLETLDPLTLYELHYQMITFGKVYCTKKNPNCNSCPMRGECRHYASAFASARLALPGTGKKARQTKKDSSTAPPIVGLEALNSIALSFLEANRESEYQTKSCEPIIEEPSSPQPEPTELPDIEDLCRSDPNYIPTIKMRDGIFSGNLKPFMGVFRENHMPTELVASQTAHIPAPKLKLVDRLRTKHLVYVVPDHHPLLAGFETREDNDPSPYLLAIWTSDQTSNSSQSPQKRCNSQESGELCIREKTCFSHSSLPEQASDTIHGTILIPCRTATRGSFPLNGTYFQVNEVFADHESSVRPINVPRSWIWRLDRRIAYFGTSTSTILKGIKTAEVGECFWAGFMGVRAFDRKTRTPENLSEKFHISTAKAGGKKNKKED
ncbi:protein ROS1-like isoform X1 [Prunus avium]|uniref:Protein ROS1-like isoform X1 n=1 Tax=Prunus avium TaxID=42229 RepID=A0A6P5TAT9_PRUAV|nr:protein ROS1-like isoform X1 [Prunus avium]